MTLTMSVHTSSYRMLVALLSIRACASLIAPTDALRASDGFNLVKFNKSSGAQCLDGTMGGFYWKAGTESTSVVVHLEGGGWCYSEVDCMARSNTAIGSSASWPTVGVPLMDGSANGVLSFDEKQNPDFYNWTKFHLNYCDGASFSGSGSTVVNGTTLQFRGAAILDAFFDALLATGQLASGGRLIVGGTSAGGLATYLHIDTFRKRLPDTVTVVGMPDAGFFLDTPTFMGANLYPSEMRYVAKMQNVSANVNQKCIAANRGADEWKCFMAEYTLPFIQTPIFAIQSAYDAWQMGNVLDLACAGDIAKCTPKQKAAFLGFRDQILDRLKPGLAKPSFGLWMDSCFLHGQQDVEGDWNTLKISGVTAARAFGDWYFKRTNVSHYVDCPYPCCDDNIPSLRSTFELHV